MLTALSVDEWLSELRRRHWTLVRWGEQRGPELLTAYLQWRTCADVLILRSEEDATAFRAPSWPNSTIFAPVKVSYQYHSGAVWTLRAILTLPMPGAPGAPLTIEEPHANCSLPDGLPRPVVIRPLAQ